MPRHELPPHDVLVHRIVSLLSRTDFTFDVIAQLVGCKPHVAAAVDREYEVREYQRLRNAWPFAAGEVEQREAS